MALLKRREQPKFSAMRNQEVVHESAGTGNSRYISAACHFIRRNCASPRFSSSRCGPVV